MEFEAFPKIRRIFKDSMIVSEKIDGTNAQVYIPDEEEMKTSARKVWAGSRNRWVEPGNDNYGFAAWVEANYEELLKLGPGRHFGEWWGKGIQRGYGLTEKRFSLFNTSRWGGNNAHLRPACCHVVPVLGCWQMDTGKIREILEELKTSGSQASPGFMDIEGIVVYHPASNQLFKYTVDDNHKDSK